MEKFSWSSVHPYRRSSVSSLLKTLFSMREM